jgi:hypothetical protein
LHQYRIPALSLVTAAVLITLAGCGGATHATTSASARPAARAASSGLATLRAFLDRISTAGEFDATYTQTLPGGDHAEFRFVRKGARARYERTALGEHVVVVTNGTHAVYCRGAEGQPASRCSDDDATQFAAKYDVAKPVRILPDLLGVGGSDVAVTRSTRTIVGRSVDCLGFSQRQPDGRVTDGMVCLTNAGVVALDDYGAHLELTTLTEHVDDGLFAALPA